MRDAKAEVRRRGVSSSLYSDSETSSIVLLLLLLSVVRTGTAVHNGSPPLLSLSFFFSSFDWKRRGFDGLFTLQEAVKELDGIQSVPFQRHDASGMIVSAVFSVMVDVLVMKKGMSSL